MLKNLCSITLAVFVLTLFIEQPFLHASGSGSGDHGPHDLLERGKTREYNMRGAAQTEFDNLQSINILVTPLSLAYAAAEAQIEKGKTVSISTALGMIASTIITKKPPIPTLGSITGKHKRWECLGRVVIIFCFGITKHFN